MCILYLVVNLVGFLEGQGLDTPVPFGNVYDGRVRRTLPVLLRVLTSD